MEAIIAGLIARSTASGWLLCCIGLVGLFQLGRILAVQRPKMKELEIGEQAGIRGEFIAEMHALRDEIKGLREENKSLRDEVRELHGVIEGMRRENLSAQLTAQSAVIGSLPEEVVPPATRAALDRLPAIKQ